MPDQGEAHRNVVAGVYRIDGPDAVGAARRLMARGHRESGLRASYYIPAWCSGVAFVSLDQNRDVAARCLKDALCCGHVDHTLMAKVREPRHDTPPPTIRDALPAETVASLPVFITRGAGQ